MEILPLGTVVRLRKTLAKLMIINRMPLFNDSGLIGYFEYSGCLYPIGQNDDKRIFFNNEDIDEICFVGYKDETEKRFCRLCREQMEKNKYPKLKVSSK